MNAYGTSHVTSPFTSFDVHFDALKSSLITKENTYLKFRPDKSRRIVPSWQRMIERLPTKDFRRVESKINTSNLPLSYVCSCIYDEISLAVPVAPVKRAFYLCSFTFENC